MKKVFAIVLCLLLLTALPFSVSAAAPWVVDEAGLLTADQIAELEAGCAQLHSDTGMELVFLTVNSLDGKTAMAYADDYFDANYGTDGILLLIDMGSRQWHISTAGTAIEAFAETDLMDMEDGLMRYLPDGQYYDAFCLFLSDVQYYATDEGVSDFAASLFIAIPVGALIAGIVLLIMRGMMNTKNPRHSAEDYLNRGSYRLTRNQDLFLYSNVTKTPRPQQTSSSGGGSSVHRSSSGRSHGGRGGRF